MFLTLCLDNTRVEISRRFYERLGLSFAGERHGPRGLAHFSTVVSEMPIEIYPAIKGLPLEDRLFIGFAVDAPVALGIELIEHFGGSEVEPPIPPTLSGIVTLRDPDGLLVRLFPKTLPD